MGRLGAPRLRGCIVTQPPSLCSFVERKKGVGVIYQLGFSHFCLGEARVLQVSVEPKTPCAPGRLQREDSQVHHTQTHSGVGPLPTLP